MAYGLLDSGFVPKTFDVIQEEITAALRTELGLSVVTGVLAKVRDIFAERETKLWELGEAIYHSQDPSSATGDALATLCELTGTLRLEATRSIVTLYLTGTNATSVPLGSRVAVTSTAQQFETTAAATLATATSWASSTAYLVNQVRTNATRIYICITAGTSAGSGGPTTTSSDITDGTAHWKYMGEGAAYATAAAQAVNTGPIVGIAGDITTIVSAVGGWSNVYNPLDADTGTDIETDGALRVRRAQELAASGVSTPDAIRQAILAISGVEYCHIFYNDTDVTVDGIPPHAVEAVVRSNGQVDALIFDALRDHVAAGIVTYGTTTGTSVDSEGVEQVFSFTEAEEVLMYVDLEYQYIAADAPLDYDDQVKAAIVAWGNARRVGYNVAATGVSAQAFTVAGIEKVTQCFIDDASSPSTDTDVVISSRQIAVFDTSRIATTASAFTI